jgi:hypothetical protein
MTELYCNNLQQLEESAKEGKKREMKKIYLRQAEQGIA